MLLLCHSSQVGAGSAAHVLPTAHSHHALQNRASESGISFTGEKKVLQLKLRSERGPGRGKEPAHKLPLELPRPVLSSGPWAGIDSRCSLERGPSKLSHFDHLLQKNDVKIRCSLTSG